MSGVIICNCSGFNSHRHVLSMFFFFNNANCSDFIVLIFFAPHVTLIIIIPKNCYSWWNFPFKKKYYQEQRAEPWAQRVFGSGPILTIFID